MSFELSEEENEEAASPKPQQYLPPSARGASLRWGLRDLTSHVDGGRAKVIGGGSFGERKRVPAEGSVEPEIEAFVG